MNKLFQYIVVSALILQIFWFFMPYSWEYFYDEKELNLFAYHGYDSIIDMYGVIPYIMMLLYIVASAGLVLFKSWALKLFLALTIITALPIWGVFVSPSIDSSIGYIIALLYGVILTIAYLTNVRNEFN